MKILFPAGHDWEAGIRSGFRSTPHEIDFADFTPDNIRHHDLIVPLTIANILQLNDLRDEVRDNPIPIPSMESVTLCDDKLLLNRALIASGFEANVPRLGVTKGYPYILKKRIDQWGVNSHVVISPDDEIALAQKISDMDYFCQEYIFGQVEYATHAVCSKGRIVRAETIEDLFDKEVFIRGREPNCGRSNCPCPFLGLFEQILASIGLEGLCCINYKVNNGRPMIFEINPRFGATLAPLFAEFIAYLTPNPPA